MTGRGASTYELENGAVVFVKDGRALDYSLMRVHQLNALLNAMASPSFKQCSTETQDDCLWLAQTLSSEVAKLFDIVASQSK